VTITSNSLISLLFFCRHRKIGSWKARAFSFFCWAILWLISFSPTLSPPAALATLHPDHLVILVNENDPESLDVAKHYARQRGIQLSHIVRLDLTFHETISRADYEERLARPLKAKLIARGLAPTTRVVVTTFWVPLRVNALPQSDQEKDWETDAATWRTASIEMINTIHIELKQILNSLKNESGLPAPDALKSSGPTLSHAEEILGLIETTVKSIKFEIQKPTSQNIPMEQATALFKQLLQLDGLSAYTKHQSISMQLQANGKLSPKQQRSQSQLAGQILPLLLQTPSTQNRDLAYQIAQRFFGIRGVFHLAASEGEQYSHKDSEASVDSELSLLWLDRHEYALKGKTPNPLYAWDQRRAGSASDTRSMSIPTLMVSRIDAPTSALAKQMIDKAIMAEQLGLTGKVYLDARGLTDKEPLGYGDYDQSLRNMADFIKTNTSYPVILENTEKRFDQFGEASQVALYAGWYRLRHYEDAFSFNPGAIGYHIASGEAISIHNPKEKGWCKNALERGITVTIGPTGEPYLDAFPKPTEFFGLMLSGRYALVEAYYLSTRHISWRMVLFGDPLYNPWKGMALAKLRGLQHSIPRFQKLKTFPIAPSEQFFPDPAKSAQARKLKRERLLRQISTLLPSP